MEEDPTLELTIDVDRARWRRRASVSTVDFPLDESVRHRFLEGLDDIGITMQHDDAIAGARVAATGMAGGRSVADVRFGDVRFGDVRTVSGQGQLVEPLVEEWLQVVAPAHLLRDGDEVGRRCVAACVPRRVRAECLEEGAVADRQPQRLQVSAPR